jgi:hypothetical protein
VLVIEVYIEIRKIKFWKCLLLFSLQTVLPVSAFPDYNDGTIPYSTRFAQMIVTILETEHETNRQDATSEYLDIKILRF